MERLDAAAVRAWAHASRSALAGSRDRIDAVNVFPVAGLRHRHERAAHRRRRRRGARRRPAVPGEDARDVARAFARGAMRSARGNSGVIVSQYLTGFAQALPARRRTRVDVARCLGAAARAARGAMQEPQEGTVLTLADAVARSAATAADAGADLADDARLRRRGRAPGARRDQRRAPRAPRRARPRRRRVRAARGARRPGPGARRRARRRRLLAGCRRRRPTRGRVEPAGGAFEVMLLVSSADTDLDADPARGDGGARRLGRGRRR